MSLLAKLLSGTAALLFSVSVLAQEAPDVMVKRVTDEVLEIVRADKELQNGSTRRAIDLVDKKVLPNFDFVRMTQLALGREWRKADARQQKLLVDEFRTLLVRTYSTALTSYRDQKVDYKPFRMQPTDTDVIVRTQIRQPGAQPIQLDYNLVKGADAWKVVDVIVGGVSLVTNYRGEFATEVSQGGIDGLIKRLQERNKEAEAKLAKGGAK